MSPLSDHDPQTSPLVTAEWLLAHVADPDLVILDARISRGTTADGRGTYSDGRQSFEVDGHIPGALYADLFQDFSDPAGRFLFTRPQAAQLETAAARLGIRDGSTVVVYDSLNGAWASRVWWVLRAYGQCHAVVLDGGLAAWTAAGGALQFGSDRPPGNGDFRADLSDRMFLDVPAVRAVVAGTRDAVMLCATQRAEFTGEGSEDPRRGHIPGSFSLPYAEILTVDGRLDLSRLIGEIERLQLTQARSLVLYCGGGINAAGLALGLASAGLSNIGIFDGSLNEWRADPELPLETGDDGSPGKPRASCQTEN